MVRSQLTLVGILAKNEGEESPFRVNPGERDKDSGDGKGVGEGGAVLNCWRSNHQDLVSILSPVCALLNTYKTRMIL